jgi:hypothetical protein
MTKKAVRLTEDMLPNEVVDQLNREPFEMDKAESLIPVRIIRENGPTALVEWSVFMADGQPDWRRAYVPKEVIHDLRVEASELDAGTAYGVRWEEFVTVTATPQQIGMELRRRGIWTEREFETRIMEAQSAFWAAYGADLGTMLQKVRKQEDD